MNLIIEINFAMAIFTILSMQQKHAQNLNIMKKFFSFILV